MLKGYVFKKKKESNYKVWILILLKSCFECFTFSLIMVYDSRYSVSWIVAPVTGYEDGKCYHIVLLAMLSGNVMMLICIW